MESITIALDWTPNVNHVGFFVANALGFYKQAHLQVTITSPADDNYAETPAKKLSKGLVDFAICPMESIISYQTASTPFLMKAVMAIFDQDLSAIVTLKRDDIQTAKDLDGITYASYKAKYEDRIVVELIKNAGGHGAINIIYPHKLGIWDTLLSGKADATWVFMNWEGLEAALKGIELKAFTLQEHGIPYSYSPVIAADAHKIQLRTEAYSQFLKATIHGYLHAKAYPEDAAKILQQVVPEKDKNLDFLTKSILNSAKAIAGVNTGLIEYNRVAQFVQWLNDKGLESNPPSPDLLFTNELLK